MFVIRTAFPSVVNPDKHCIFEWPFRGSISELSWEGFVERLCEQTKTKKGKFFVTWHDGTEYCTVSTTESLRDAVTCMIQERPDKTALLYIYPVDPKDKSHLSSFYGSCMYEDLPKDFREQVDTVRPLSESEYMLPDRTDQYELVCGKCGKRDWKGDKYTCVICPKQVFCPACYRGGAHSEHPILITREEMSYPCQILQAVKVVAANLRNTERLNKTRLQESEEEDGGRMEDSDEDACCSKNPAAEPEDPKVVAAVQQLREMGFKQDYNRLSKLAKDEDGDICSMLDKLSDF
ncbi:unnamed protein product [Calicophoron daubneyi]|uniref:UBA domain-containing protein n=1 Tax=Calicophoron daubneyi TaxID=300641 RepID=A0AAV2TDS7_CALDB